MGNALDVAIGVVFVYLLLALIVTTVQELLSTVLSLRAQHLYSAIEHMLKSNNTAMGERLTNQLYRHPLIVNLVKTALPEKPGFFDTLCAKGLPSYIPSKTFALALLDVLQGTAERKENDPTPIFKGVEALFNNAKTIVLRANVSGDLKNALLVLLDDAKDKSTATAEEVVKAVSDASDRVEGLFNDRMARAGGWYKRKMQLVSLVLALGVTLAFNADTLRIARELWQNTTLREQVAAVAQTYHDTQGAPKDAAAAPDPAQLKILADSVVKQSHVLLNLGLPMGWPDPALSVPPTATKQAKEQRCVAIWVRVLGWLITALAVSLGAAFWFDVLSKALQLRGSGPKVSAATGELEAKGAAK
jgi:hypothetical protein